MAEILQESIPYDPLQPVRLPGTSPVAEEDWLVRDEAFAAQMARRDRLVQDRRDAVIALEGGARGAAAELLDKVLALAYGGAGAGGKVARPDGETVAIDRSDPMGTLARLVQEDLCILQKRGDQHVLTAAALCFPASWTLAEKFRHPLTEIHGTVRPYDGDVARRVQRLFDGIRAGRPLHRHNALWYDDPELFQPRSIHRRRAAPDPETAPYLRSERQCLLRLPETGAVIFSIHSYVLHRATVENLNSDRPA